jgi:hypothetical protein
MSAQKLSFLSGKPIIIPLTDEGVVSYGDRLLWHELGLQLKNRREDMLTGEEYVRTMMGFYPTAIEQNIRKYLGYFNRGGGGNGMGFRGDIPVPVPLDLPS